MPRLPEKSIDLIATDLPYQITQNKWDSLIPFPEMWEQIKHVLKPNSVFLTTGCQPFTSKIVISNSDWFKHEWIWIKNRGSNFANTVREPFREHESILVFSDGGWTYNKQMQKRTGAGSGRIKYQFNSVSNSPNYRKFNKQNPWQGEDRVPSSWLEFNTEVGLHPTQKPVALYEYLIRTYSNPGNTVLDFCFGSGTTAIACINTGRNFIGIEKEPKYFDIAVQRIKNAQMQLRLDI